MSPVCSTLLCPTVPGSTFVAGMQGWASGADFIVGHFVIGPEVQYGLTRLTKPGSDHNTTYALTLGYRF